MRKYETSRGWRNNNPLNIRRGEEWQGLVAKEKRTDGQFCQFLNMTWGFRAAARCLRAYYQLFCQQGKTWDVENIISRWAPASENDTEAYIRRVLELMGRDRGQTRLAPPHTKSGRLQLALLMAAMTCVETGCPLDAVPLDNLNAGFILAGLGDPSLKVGGVKEIS